MKPISLSLTREEVRRVRSLLGREPNKTEWAIIDVMWSEHASYKSSREYLKLFPTEGKDVVLGVGDDCGIVGFDERYAIAIAMESHNHPSAIEPVAGAATGVGGIVRDILSKGARPIACLDPLRLGDIYRDERSKYLFENIVKGIADYGNCIGVPTVGGDAEFDKSFNKNPLVNVVGVGLVERDKIIRGVASNVGDTLLLVGSKTGRDGIHGVTFASEELKSENEEESRPAVQIEDPLSEKLLIDALMEVYETGAVSGCKDLGGGGFVCATSEMVSKGGKGALIDIGKVHLREEGMEPWEILVSETQERMMLAVKRGREEEVEKILDKWGVQHARVGVVIEERRYIVKHNGRIVVDLPVEIITNPPTIHRRYKEGKRKEPEKPKIQDYEGFLMGMLADPNIASKRWIYEQYDHEVQTRTVIKPGMDAAVLKISDREGIALGIGCNSKHCRMDPVMGARGAVAEAVRNVTAVGGRAIAAVDCLNFGNPEKPEAFWKFKVSVEGIAEGLKAFGIPVVSGNVSFYNEADGTPIAPSPIVAVLGRVRLERIMTMGLREKGESIVVIGDTREEMGMAPVVDFERERAVDDLILELNDIGSITACHDLSKGGLAVGLAKMAFVGGKGFDVDIGSMPEKITVSEKLFSESSGRFVVTSAEAERVVERARGRGVSAQIIGEVGGKELSYGPFSVDLKEAEEVWERGLRDLLV